MQKKTVNPRSRSVNLGYNQSEVIQGVKSHLNCARQTTVDLGGNPQHFDDMRAQVSLTIDNLEGTLQLVQI